MTGLAVLALVALAASLGSLTLEPGSPLPLKQMAPDLQSEAIPDSWGQVLVAIMRVIFILGWVFLPFYIIYLIISKEARRQFIRDLMIFLPMLLVLYFLSTNAASRAMVDELTPGMSGKSMEVMEMPEGVEPPVFTEPPDWVTTLTSLVLAIGLALLVAGFIFMVWQRSRQRPLQPLHLVEKEAQAAIDAIQAGGDLRDVIMRCYYQMLTALSEYRNISRERDMTPHEFEVFLQQRGLPSTPVHQLTVLFEQVRYGMHNPGRQDERAAIASLSAIVSACQRTRAQQEQARHSEA